MATTNNTRERATELRKKGLSCTEIAEELGVSRQRIHQICGSYGPGHFKTITEEQCTYPIWRKCMNENRITRNELIRRMGLAPHPRTSCVVGMWMRGEAFPRKSSIDKLIKATGLTYEQLFYREEETCQTE